MSGRVLLVDDDRNLSEVFLTDLGSRGYGVTWVSTVDEAQERLATERFDVVLTDLNFPGKNGIELCRHVAHAQPGVPVVVMTAFGTVQNALAAVRAGAYDFVVKPVELDVLAIALTRAVDHRRLTQRLSQLGAEVERARQLEDMLGESPVMQRLFEQISQVAATDASILIVGATGTGKELVARALHRLGRRAQGPFVAVNCAAVPAQLLEAELFGHVKGAFTDAGAPRLGLFQRADGGTLLLDELGELPLDLQPKLLRALEERRLRPVGGDEEVGFDVRLLASTNRDLLEEVDEGRFREDLYYRINVIQLELPPLRARGADVLLLAQRFLEAAAARGGKPSPGLGRAAARLLLEYDWPGNVRELRNVVERAVALARGPEVAVEDLPDRLLAVRAVAGPPALAVDAGALPSLDEMERRYVQHVVEAVGGNRSLAARTLGIDRKTLHRKLQRYRMEPR